MAEWRRRRISQSGRRTVSLDGSTAGPDGAKRGSRDTLSEHDLRRIGVHPDLFADVVICNTVLHFARDDAHFRSMLQGAWRTLKPGGLFFSRLASTIGSDHLLKR